MIPRLLLLACLTLSPMAAAAAPWHPVASGHRPTALAEIRALAEAFPESAIAQARLLGAADTAGDAALVRTTLRRLAAMGHALPADRQAALARHLPAGEAERLAARFRENAREIAASRVFSMVPAEHAQIEAVAWDARRNRAYVTSTIGRRLLVHEGGRWTAIPDLDLGNPIGLAADPRRRLLWIASAASWGTTEERASRFRGLVAISLDDHRVVRRVPLAMAGHSPLDIGVAGDGTVYASESTTGAIFHVRPGDTQATILIPPGRLPSPHGIAVSPDQRRLYIADYRSGVAIVDRASGAIERLEGSPDMMLNAGDGIAAIPGGLILIQNDELARRIVRVTLDRSGRRATALRVLEQYHADWGWPTLGQVRGRDLIYVSDAQWDRYDENGARTGDVRPTAIRVVPIGRR